MVSEHTAPTSPTPAPRRRSGWIITLAGLLLGLLALIGTATWLLQSQSAAQRVLAMLSTATAIQFEGIHGTLAGPLQIDRVIVERPSQRVTLENLRLDWRPRALLRRQLHIVSLQVSRLLVTSKISQKNNPVTLPLSLALPITVQLDQATIDSGEIGWGPVNLIKLGAFAFSLGYDSAQYRLNVQKFAASSGQPNADISGDIQGEATLAATRPFAVQGRFTSSANAMTNGQKIGAQGTLQLTGSLADLIAGIDLASQQAQIKGHATLRPFSDHALANADVAFSGIDLSAFRATLPKTDLNGSLTAAADGSGKLKIINRNAGDMQENRLPLNGIDVNFQQSAAQFNFDQITVLLGTSRQPAGTISGKGKYKNGALTLALSANRIDLHRVDRRLHPTQLSGNMNARHQAGIQQLSLNLKQPIGKRAMTLTADASIADEKLSLNHADVQIGDAHLNASGKMALAGNQAFDASGQISHFHLRDIGDFPQLPALDLNAKFSVRGARLPAFSANVAFTIDNSQLAGRPLLGRGEARLGADKILVPTLFIAAGDNRLDLHGELSTNSSKLLFTVAAPKLEQLGSGMGGALSINGTASGSVKQPHILADWKALKLQTGGQLHIAQMQGHADVTLDSTQPFATAKAAIEMQASDIALAANRVGTLNARIAYGAQANAPLDIHIDAQHIDTPQLLADTFSLSTQGVTAHHTLHAALTESRNVQTWKVEASGDLRTIADELAWQGSIDRVDADGRLTGRLTSSAPFSVSHNGVTLDNFVMDTSIGHLVLDRFAKDAQGITTRGHAEHILLAKLLQLRGAHPALSTNLQFGATWDIALAPTLRGSIEIQRQDGDLTVLSGKTITLGLSELHASLNADANRVQVKLDAAGQQLGEVRVSATADARHGVRLPLSPDTVIAGNAKIAIPSLAWVTSLASAATIGDGSLNGELTLSGTYGKPQLKGRIAGRDLRIYHGESGVDLQHGTLDADFSDDRLLVHHLDFRSDDGALAASGQVNFEGGTPTVDIALKAQHFRLLNRSDRKLTLSGAGNFGWQQQHHLSATGAFKIDSGFFDIGREDTPQLSDDVVIVGRNGNAITPLASAIDIDVDLGDDMKISGRGLEAKLTGSIHLNSVAGKSLRAQGRVHVDEGSYTAYGRKLAIEQGELRFTGDIANPALDILAMRRGLEVEAGVAVRGTVMSPRVTLVSEPSVPEAEKLSWLVLGRGLSSAGSSDMGALQAAAATLLSDSAASGVTSQIATAFGLDTLSIGSSDDNLQQRIVTIGKRISSRLYVGYQQSLQTVGSVLNLRYTLSPRLTIEAEAGTRSALSLLYNITFD